MRHALFTDKRPAVKQAALGAWLHLLRKLAAGSTPGDAGACAAAGAHSASVAASQIGRGVGVRSPPGGGAAGAPAQLLDAFVFTRMVEPVVSDVMGWERPDMVADQQKKQQQAAAAAAAADAAAAAAAAAPSQQQLQQAAVAAAAAAAATAAAAAAAAFKRVRPEFFAQGVPQVVQALSLCMQCEPQVVRSVCALIAHTLCASTAAQVLAPRTQQEPQPQPGRGEGDAGAAAAQAESVAGGWALRSAPALLLVLGRCFTRLAAGAAAVEVSDPHHHHPDHHREGMEMVGSSLDPSTSLELHDGSAAVAAGVAALQQTWLPAWQALWALVGVVQGAVCAKGRQHQAAQAELLQPLQAACQVLQDAQAGVQVCARTGRGVLLCVCTKGRGRCGAGMLHVYVL